MKKLCVLMLLAATALAQNYQTVTVYPYPNPTTIDSLRFKSGSDTLWGMYKQVDSVVTSAGSATLKIYRLADQASFATITTEFNVYFPGGQDTLSGDGQRVVANVGDSTITLTKGCSTTDSNAVVYFVKRDFAVSTGTRTSAVGYPVYSKFLPANTVIESWIDSCTVLLSNKATTDTNATTGSLAELGYYKGTQTAYATGEIVGVPFFFDKNIDPGMTLYGVEVLDSAAQAQNVDVVIYDTLDFDFSADNAAFAPGGASFDNVVGYGTVATFKAIGANTSLGYVYAIGDPVTAPKRRGMYAGVLVSRGTGNFFGNRSLAIKLIFAEP